MNTHKHDLNKMAFHATSHCLTGCALGEVLGFVIGASFNLGVALTIFISVVLAFIFSYALTMFSLLSKSRLPLSFALGIAFAADTASVSSMEIIDNLMMVIIPGATAAKPDNFLFWGSLAIALAVAFILTFPLNRWLISRGKGHAVIMHH